MTLPFSAPPPLPHPLWSRNWTDALDMALLIDDHDTVAAVLAMREAQLCINEMLEPCGSCGAIRHAEDSCLECGKS